MKTTVKRLKTRKTIMAALVAATVAEVGAPTPALAQGMLEEVVVSARKREESLQETPVAVTALSGDRLEEAGLNQLTDLSKVVPNLHANTSSNGGFASLFIRGVGARNSGINFDGGVAVYQDGVYLSRPDGNLLDSVDIQSVQVLRGPQGTLFGKNSTGGAILYTTNRPSDVFEGLAEINVGDYERLNSKLTVNVPLVDEFLYSRLSIYSSERDGWVEDQFGRELSNQDRYGGQLQFRFLAGDNVTVDLNSQYGKTDQASTGQQCEQATGVPGAGWQSDLQDPFIVEPGTGQSILDWCAESQKLDKDKVLSALTGAVKPIYGNEVKSLAGTVEWVINEDISFKSITAWRNIEATQQDDIYGIGIPLLNRVNEGFTITEPRDTDWFSQEFQFTGAALDGDVDYVLGLFYSNEENKAGNSVGQGGPFWGVFGNPNNAYYTAQGTELLTDNTSYAAFSQADWAINDSWSLTLGLRYTSEERELDRNEFLVDADTLSTGAPATNIVSTFYAFPDGSNSFNPGHGYVTGNTLSDKIDNSDWNPMGSIRYLFEGDGWIEGGSAYFTIATGFLSGGLSENVDFNGNIPEYDPEEVINYEVGVKLDALDNTLRLNAALFYTEYEDRQLTNVVVNSDTGTIQPQTVNAEESSIAGLELETTWLATANLELTFNYSYADDNIDKFDDTTLSTVGGMPDFDCETIQATGGPLDVCAVDRTHERLPNLPEHSFYLAGQYTWETDIGAIIARLDAAYSKSTNTCFDFHSCAWEGGEGLEYDLLNVGARLTWMSEDAKWRVTAWGDNLTDDREATAGIPLVSTTETTGKIWSPPRTYGVQMAYTW
jgi:iron complex outermembrane recepter protein